MHLDYARLGKTSKYTLDRPFIPCRGVKVVQSLEIESTICFFNVFALDSGKRLETKLLRSYRVFALTYGLEAMEDTHIDRTLT